jgi:hypothetical protein
MRAALSGHPRPRWTCKMARCLLNKPTRLQPGGDKMQTRIGCGCGARTGLPISLSLGALLLIAPHASRATTQQEGAPPPPRDAEQTVRDGNFLPWTFSARVGNQRVSATMGIRVGIPRQESFGIGADRSSTRTTGSVNRAASWNSSFRWAPQGPGRPIRQHCARRSSCARERQSWYVRCSLGMSA